MSPEKLPVCKRGCRSLLCLVFTFLLSGFYDNGVCNSETLASLLA
jgi:hypothetical protein